MAATPVYALPYPTVSDAPDGPAQIRALAEATEAKLVLVDAAAAALLPGTVGSIQVTSGTTASATYTATLTGGTACSVAFVAPASGKVIITNTVQSSNSGANNSFCAPHVRNGAVIGSGTDVLASSDDEAHTNTGTNALRFSAERLLQGLTAGASYNVVQEFKASAGTATFTRKSLIVTPVFA